jgi:hypothetical protein
MTENTFHRVLSGSLFGLAICGGAISVLADPFDYEDHRDTIMSSTGNANAANIAVQTIDPWPPYSKNTKNHLDGRRAAVAVTRYQQNKSIEPHGLATTTISEQAGPGAQSSTSLSK